MFIARHKASNRRGFTLLEVMLAVAILGMMSLAIFRFVQANLTALSLSSETVAADAQYDGLRDLLTAHWQSLSPTRAAMIGEVFKLSDRERDVLRLLATGLSNADIAQTLFLSDGTVKNYVSLIFSKLGVADRTQAAILAIRAGVIQL